MTRRRAVIMESELIIFWRLKSGVRCVVAEGQGITRWQLRVVRESDPPLLVEDFSDAVELFARARALQSVFAVRFPGPAPLIIWTRRAQRSAS